jgi:anti-sigma regulatory factor (Ser/Thr protein kinase)
MQQNSMTRASARRVCSLYALADSSLERKIGRTDRTEVAVLDWILRKSTQVKLPACLDGKNIRNFLSTLFDDEGEPKCGRIEFDFAPLDFIDPVGVVVLSNIIEYIHKEGGSVKFSKSPARTHAIGFLDDSGFFERYEGKRLFKTSHVRQTTMPLRLVHSGQWQSYLRGTLMPWIGGHVGMQAESLDGLRVSIEEVLHNIEDHSKVKIGCTFAQFFPNKKRIQLAIADFGEGIPRVVASREQGLSNAAAIRRACDEGFTTRSNVRNRGAGLPTLLRYVTMNNGGQVMIASGNGEVNVYPDTATPKIISRSKFGFLPGTLVRIELRTDTLERALEDADQEPFSWDI